jgi:membrane protein YdbS with pleckstrin-like domain
MYELIRRWALAILKAPGEPHPPMGDPASLKVFNAGRNYYRLRIFRWALVQILALIGILFWTAFLIDVENTARTQAAERAKQPAVPESATTTPAKAPTGSKQRFESWKKRLQQNLRAAAKSPNKGKGYRWWAGFKQTFVEIALLLPSGAFVLIMGLKLISFLVYLVQLPFTYAVRRLDYEMRWYMVTDRSLRLRHGVWKISEATMSFANIQQVAVSQGPLQRLLGLADVKVKSAGGGGGGGHYDHGDVEMHTGLFHSVTNAAEIRDLILDRLRRFREAGLGDPDEKVSSNIQPAAVTTPGPISPDALTAAHELAAEARRLRASFLS